jgi:lysophospholipase L1-like esterase
MLKKKFSIPSYRLFLRIFLAISSLTLVSLATVFTNPASAAGTDSPPPQEYLALGDSVAFGVQPNGNFSHGYAQDLSGSLQAQNFSQFSDLGCPGETSSSFMYGNSSGNIPVPNCRGPQLSGALADLHQHKTSLVTLQLGANDILNAVDPYHCTVNSDLFNNDLNQLDLNLTQTILPQLYITLTRTSDQPTDLVLVEYYNPLQQACPNSAPYFDALNAHLETDAGIGHATVAHIADSFTPSNVCDLTWICSNTPDIHPTSQGYQVIANDIYQQLSFTNPS